MPPKPDPDHITSPTLSHYDSSAQSFKPGGVLFSSNPRGNNQEGFQSERYCCHHNLETWRDFVTTAGFTELHHYYRPEGLPREHQSWLATVWRK